MALFLQQAGGGVYVHSGVLHLDRTVVRENVAAEGAGVCLVGGSRLSASRSQLGGNRLSGSSEAAGTDILLAGVDENAAYMEPLPAAGELSGEMCGRVACVAAWLGSSRCILVLPSADAQPMSCTRLLLF